MNNIIIKSFGKFIVMALLIGGRLMIQPSLGYGQGQDQHTMFTDALSIYVKDGKVDYKNIKDDFRFIQYIEQIQSTNPNKIKDENDRMAFWINAYNAFTIKLIVDNYPLKSINDLHKGGLILGTVLKSTIWDAEIFVVNNEKISLNFIEHEILRAQFDEPRIHFAIVCASISCPPLRSEAYEGYKLDEQLQDQGRRFFAQTEKNSFDFKRNIATLSPILKWFKTDFGENNKEVLTYVSQFLDPQRAREIVEYIDTWKIKYSRYDWNLNEW